MAEIKPSEVTSILRQQLQNFNQKSEMEEVGTVLLVGDGIARVYGLQNARSGELVTFSTKNGDEITGIALNLEEDNVGVVLLGDSKSLNEGDICKRTGRIASIKVGEGLLGRVINTLGQPIDGKGDIEGELIEMPIERKCCRPSRLQHTGYRHHGEDIRQSLCGGKPRYPARHGAY